MRCLPHHAQHLRPCDRVCTYTTPKTPRASPHPALGRSSSFELRTTFYCPTCAAEFEHAEQDRHLSTTATWRCELCAYPAERRAGIQHRVVEARRDVEERYRARDEGRAVRWGGGGIAMCAGAMLSGGGRRAMVLRIVEMLLVRVRGARAANRRRNRNRRSLNRRKRTKRRNQQRPRRGQSSAMSAKRTKSRTK